MGGAGWMGGGGGQAGRWVGSGADGRSLNGTAVRRVGKLAGVKLGGSTGFRMGGATDSAGGLQKGVEGCRGPCHLGAETFKCHGAGLTVRGGAAPSRPRQGTPSGVF